jgi:hypothetical protein
MKKNTTLIIVGVVTLGVGAVIYFNWEWINKNLLGKVGLSKAHGTVQGIVDEGEGIATGSINTDANNLIEEETSDTENFDSEGNMITATLDNLVFPTYEEDVWVKSVAIGCQIHKVDSGMYQFMFTQQAEFGFTFGDCPIIQAMKVSWKFGNTDWVGPYLPSERPVTSFPETGIYTIQMIIVVGNNTDGDCASMDMQFDMQVVL